MDLVQRLADRMLLVHRGRAVLAGTLAQVRAASATGKKVVLQLEGVSASNPLERLAMVEHIEARAEGEYAFSLRPGASLNHLLTALAARFTISEVRSAAPSLHEIFLRTVNDESLRQELEAQS